MFVLKDKANSICLIIPVEDLRLIKLQQTPEQAGLN